MDPMNLREKLGAIPLLGTIVGAITLYNQRSRSPTDQKISTLVHGENTPIKIVYQKHLAIMEETAINKRNARHELIPIWGTLHHLFWRFMPIPHNTGLHSLRGQPAFVRAQAAIKTLNDLGKPDEAALVQTALDQLKNDPRNEDKILHLFNTIHLLIK